MNRIILIGNGFDLAHGLKTKYENFINWYWEQRIIGFNDNTSIIDKDILCSFSLVSSGSFKTIKKYAQKNCRISSNKKIIDVLKKIEKDLFNINLTKTNFFKRINECIETKGWVDIEYVYYQYLAGLIYGEGKANPIKLNEEFDYLRSLLIKYLNEVQRNFSSNPNYTEKMKNAITTPIKPCEIAVEAKESLDNLIETRKEYTETDWSYLYENNGRTWNTIQASFLSHIKDDIKTYGFEQALGRIFPSEFLLPDNILILNFNYTNIADNCFSGIDSVAVNHIHGELSHPESIIFGYGDELDENYKKIQNLNDNEYLRNVKSVRYLESDNYRKVLSFVESAPYQIYVMGHSCGNSDRTLLNKLFEHKNCVSIKPFYHQYEENGTLKDNYLDLVQNISRNFNDKSLMRDRVVNKTYCEPLPQIRNNQEPPQP